MHCSQHYQPLPFTVASNRPLPWKGREIKWHLNNTTDQLRQHEQLMLLDDVVKDLNDIIYPLRMVSTDRRQDAYFQLYWVTGNKVIGRRGQELIKNPYPFTSNIMAVAYPRWGSPWDGTVLINNDITITKTKFKKMVLHEWLHGYGLGHTNAKGDIMNRSYNPKYSVTADTIKGMDKLLGPAKKEAQRLLGLTPPALQNNRGCLAVLGNLRK